MAERKFKPEIFFATDDRGGGGKGPDPKEVARDASLHRSAYLIQGTPVGEPAGLQKQPQVADTSETGFPDILASLHKLTGFTPPSGNEGEKDSSSQGSKGSGSSQS